MRSLAHKEGDPVRGHPTPSPRSLVPSQAVNVPVVERNEQYGGKTYAVD